MALSSVTLKQLKSDLRSRLPNISRDITEDGSITRWLNLGQYETANNMGGMAQIWYGAKATVTESSGEITIPTGTWKVIKLVDATNGIFGFRDTNFFSQLSGMSSYDEAVIASQFGQTIQVFKGADITAFGVMTLWYYKKPTEMTSDASLMDVPTEFQEFVVGFAEIQALKRIGQTQEAALKGKELQDSLTKALSSFGSEMSLEAAEQRGVDQ